MVIDAVIRPEDIVITDEEKGQIKGEVISSDFKGTFYIVVVQSGKKEIEIHSLNNYKEGAKVGLCIAPDNIHIIPYDTSINHYEGVLTKYVEDKGILVEFEDFEVYAKPAQIFGDVREEDGIILDDNGREVTIEGVKVEAKFIPAEATLSDNAEAGIITGNIISFIYVDDHYRYTVRSKSEEDYIVNDEYLWNKGDYVSIVIPEDKLTYRVIENN